MYKSLCLCSFLCSEASAPRANPRWEMQGFPLHNAPRRHWPVYSVLLPVAARIGPPFAVFYTPFSRSAELSTAVIWDHAGCGHVSADGQAVCTILPTCSYWLCYQPKATSSAHQLRLASSACGNGQGCTKRRPAPCWSPGSCYPGVLSPQRRIRPFLLCECLETPNTAEYS